MNDAPQQESILKLHSESHRKNISRLFTVLDLLKTTRSRIFGPVPESTKNGGALAGQIPGTINELRTQIEDEKQIITEIEQLACELSAI